MWLYGKYVDSRQLTDYLHLLKLSETVKEDLFKYQLVISYGLLVRIFTYQPTVDKTIVLSTNS